MFEWDRHNLRKIKAHRLQSNEVEQALQNNPILIYQQGAEGEHRYVYYGETDSLRPIAIVLTERDDRIRVITAYDLDAGQSATISSGGYLRNKDMVKRNPKQITIPKFANEDVEATWWASKEGRAFLKQQPSKNEGLGKGSKLVAKLAPAQDAGARRAEPGRLNFLFTP